MRERCELRLQSGWSLLRFAGVPHCCIATGLSLAPLHSLHKEGISSFIYSISCHVDPKMAPSPLQNCPVSPLWLPAPILSPPKCLMETLFLACCCFLLDEEGWRVWAWWPENLHRKVLNLWDLPFCVRVVLVGVGTGEKWKGALRTSLKKTFDDCLTWVLDTQLSRDVRNELSSPSSWCSCCWNVQIFPRLTFLVSLWKGRLNKRRIP